MSDLHEGSENDMSQITKIDLPRGSRANPTPSWAIALNDNMHSTITSMNISMNDRISALEHKLLTDVKSAKDTANEALSLVKECKQDMDNLNTKYSECSSFIGKRM